MGVRVGNRIDRAFDAAEREGRWLMPTSSADSRWLQRAANRGEVLRPYPGVFARASSWNDLGYEQSMLYTMRALAAMHCDVTFAGASAAIAHGLELGITGGYRICMAARPGVHVKPSKHCQFIKVDDDEFVEREGVRVTSFLRTVYDCLRSLPFPAALAVADSALRTKGITRARLAANLKKICRRRRGLQRVLDIVALADGRAENGGESRVRAAVIALGFVAPDLQRVFPDPMDASRVYRADFVWDLPDGTIVVGELDGRDKYVDPEMTGGRGVEDVVREERQREARITLNAHAVRVMRFSFKVVETPEFFARLLDSYGVPRADKVAAVAV